MRTKMWLVRAASLAVAGSLTVAAFAQKAPKKAQSAAPAPAEPPKPPASTTPEKEEEGPFAPKGRTGKLREEAKPEEEKPAEGKKEAAPRPAEKPGAAGADIVFGFGKTGDPTGPDGVELSVVSFLIGGSYQVNKEWGVRLRFPFSTGKITHLGPAVVPFEKQNEGYNATAFGNVELAANYTFDLAPAVKLPLELALVVPTASGDRFPPPDDLGRGRSYRINAAAAASRGVEEDALFTPHRLGIVPKGSLRYREGAIETGAYLKVPVLIKAGGLEPAPRVPSDNFGYAQNSTVIMGVLGADFHYALVENKFDVGARAWASLMSNDYYDVIYSSAGGVTAPSKFQLVFEPQVRAAFGPVRGTLGFIWPLGGRLGGDQQVNGVRLAGAYVF